MRPAPSWRRWSRATGIVRRSPKLVGAALVCGYGPAWYTHAFIERNKPETFSAPLRSLASDYRMCWGLLTGTLDDDLRRANAKARRDDRR